MALIATTQASALAFRHHARHVGPLPHSPSGGQFFHRPNGNRPPSTVPAARDVAAGAQALLPLRGNAKQQCHFGKLMFGCVVLKGMLLVLNVMFSAADGRTL